MQNILIKKNLIHRPRHLTNESVTRSTMRKCLILEGPKRWIVRTGKKINQTEALQNQFMMTVEKVVELMVDVGTKVGRSIQSSQNLLSRQILHRLSEEDLYYKDNPMVGEKLFVKLSGGKANILAFFLLNLIPEAEMIEGQEGRIMVALAAGLGSTMKGEEVIWIMAVEEAMGKMIEEVMMGVIVGMDLCEEAMMAEVEVQAKMIAEGAMIVAVILVAIIEGIMEEDNLKFISKVLYKFLQYTVTLTMKQAMRTPVRLQHASATRKSKQKFQE